MYGQNLHDNEWINEQGKKVSEFRKIRNDKLFENSQYVNNT